MVCMFIFPYFQFDIATVHLSTSNAVQSFRFPHFFVWVVSMSSVIVDANAFDDATCTELEKPGAQKLCSS